MSAYKYRRRTLKFEEGTLEFVQAYKKGLFGNKLDSKHVAVQISVLKSYDKIINRYCDVSSVFKIDQRLEIGGKQYILLPCSDLEGMINKFKQIHIIYKKNQQKVNNNYIPMIERVPSNPNRVKKSVHNAHSLDNVINQTIDINDKTENGFLIAAINKILRLFSCLNPKKSGIIDVVGSGAGSHHVGNWKKTFSTLNTSLDEFPVTYHPVRVTKGTGRIRIRITNKQTVGSVMNLLNDYKNEITVAQ